ATRLPHRMFHRVQTLTRQLVLEQDHLRFTCNQPVTKMALDALTSQRRKRFGKRRRWFTHLEIRRGFLRDVRPNQAVAFTPYPEPQLGLGAQHLIDTAHLVADLPRELEQYRGAR